MEHEPLHQNGLWLAHCLCRTRMHSRTPKAAPQHAKHTHTCVRTTPCWLCGLQTTRFSGPAAIGGERRDILKM